MLAYVAIIAEILFSYYTIKLRSSLKLTPNNKGWVLGYSDITAFGDINLSEAAAVDASGNGGGDIQIQGRNLTLESGSQIETSTLGTEAGGAFKINVSDSVRLIGIPGVVSTSINTGIVSQVYKGASGDGGNLKITTDRLILENGAKITAGTAGIGDAASVRILAHDSIELTRDRKPGLGSFIVSLGERGSTGSAGEIKIDTGRLTLGFGGVISSGAFGKGQGGKVYVKASEKVEVIGKSLTNSSPSRISSRTTGLADAGNISIETGVLNVIDGGRVNVGGERIEKFVTSIKPGQGNSGNLRIQANSINLNKGTITSSTAKGTGRGTGGEAGNIFLRSDDLQLRNSAITTSAGGSGNGGNITINADTIAALEESKITANAFEGNGGNINIKATGLFASPDSAITATSEKGVDGTVNIDTVESNLSSAVVFPQKEISVPRIPLLCGRSFDGVKAAQGELYIFTSGNFPATPFDPIDSGMGWHDPTPIPEGKISELSKKLIETKPVEKYVEAQGAVWNPDGTISLTAEPTPHVVPYGSLSTPEGCLQPTKATSNNQR